MICHWNGWRRDAQHWLGEWFEKVHWLYVTSFFCRTRLTSCATDIVRTKRMWDLVYISCNLHEFIFFLFKLVYHRFRFTVSLILIEYLLALFSREAFFSETSHFESNNDATVYSRAFGALGQGGPLTP